MKTIKLGSTVIVSDPCYELPTWCQAKVEDVLPGDYKTTIRMSDQENWGTRVSLLGAVHKDYLDKPLDWELAPFDLGVDSGQLGIFDSNGYFNDEYAQSVLSEIEGEFGMNDRPGDIWYDKMCALTISDEGWGSYSEGVVSSSGYGDGSYPLYLSRNNDGKVVGFVVDFLIEEKELLFDEFNFYRPDLDYGTEDDELWNDEDDEDLK